MNLEIEIKGIEHMQKLAGTFREPALRALNKAARSTESHANKLIRQTYNITRTEVDSHVDFRAASVSKLTAILRGKGPRYPLTKFLYGSRNPRTLLRREGVQVQVRRGNVITLPGYFLATVGRGHVGIFKRKVPGDRRTEGRAKTSSANLPIGSYVRGKYKGAEATTLSVAGMMGSLQVNKPVRQFFKETLPGVFKHELNYWLSKQ